MKAAFTTALLLISLISAYAQEQKPNKKDSIKLKTVVITDSLKTIQELRMIDSIYTEMLSKVNYFNFKNYKKKVEFETLQKKLLRIKRDN